MELELQQSPGVIDVAAGLGVKSLQNNCVSCFIQKLEKNNLCVFIYFSVFFLKITWCLCN